MGQSTILNNKEKRRTAILAAALKCFLQFGYAKTSMDDVAKEANLSRPLIYLKFKNKEVFVIPSSGHLAKNCKQNNKTINCLLRVQKIC